MSRVTGLLTIAAAAPPLYRAMFRALLRRNMRHLNEGDIGPLTSTYADDVRFVFPGQSTWAGDYRGKDEVTGFVERFVETGLQIEPDEILVNGPPWNTRFALRYHDSYTAPDGEVVYENRGQFFGTIAWGKLRYYELHEDTEKVAEFDSWLAAHEPYGV
jgi:ketosteroid isomerase-like protein